MTKPTNSTESKQQGGFSRRGFLAGTAALGLTIVEPRLVTAAEANSKITVGLIGCGGRGNWIADIFNEKGGYQFIAVADYFQSRALASAKKLKVPEARAFSGLSGYKRLLETKPDAVVIETPPYFHPEQALAAAEAGCHVFCAKPIAVDVPGCLTIAEAGRKGTQNKRCVLIDFQTRADAFYREAVQRVHAGDIGPIFQGEAVYYTGNTWGGATETLAADPKNPEVRLRAWGLDRVLSGDIITEQNIHALDVASWIMGKHPLKAVGTYGKCRPDMGTCNDHFTALFTFENNAVVTFASKQFGEGMEDIGCKMFGPDGTIETHYGGKVFIRGKKSFKGGMSPHIYVDGAAQNIVDFRENILKGECSNPTVPASVRSNLTTILGRTAAYKKAEVTWDEMMKANEKFEFPTKELRA